MSHRFSCLARMLPFLTASCLVLALAGCESGEQSTPPGDSGDSDNTAAAQPSAAGLAALAKADAVDGATDKVVSKCLTCNLGMDGSPDHVAKVGDYELHLCSAHCKDGFEADPEKALLAVQIPE